MKILFLHPNMPGQYKHLARYFGAQKGTDCAFITKHKTAEIAGVSRLTYALRREPSPHVHRYLTGTERAVLQGQEVWRMAKAMRDKDGFTPDIVLAHPGWGDALFIKDLFPNAALLSFFEFYYRTHGADVGFMPDDTVDDDDLARLRVKNITNLLSLEAADMGICPTAWQYAVHPETYRSKLNVLHDGIDTDAITPSKTAGFSLPDGSKTFHHGDEVVTYIARNFEPYRGFPTFVKAAEIILKQRPNAHIIAVGADGVSYGKKPPKGKTYRHMLMADARLDHSRIHFVGTLPYDALIQLFQVSAAHIYLTLPFVLSWSMLESMAAGVALVASKTKPVEEVVEHEENGLLADFMDADAVAQQVVRLLTDKELAAHIRTRARATVERHFALKDVLPLHVQLVEALAKKGDVDAVRAAIRTHYPLQRFEPMIRAFNHA